MTLAVRSDGMLAIEPARRNQMLLRLLDTDGLRISEIAELKRRDLQPRIDADLVTVFDDGSRLRVMLSPSAIWRELLRFHKHAALDAPALASRRGGRLHPSAIERRAPA